MTSDQTQPACRKYSNHWKIPPRLFPTSGNRKSATGNRQFFLLLCALTLLAAPIAKSQTADLVRARAWLTERVPVLLADTATPVRVLATTAQALTDTNLTAQLRTAILARQRPDGFFANPGTADSLYDQTAALSALANEQPDTTLQTAYALLTRQHKDGGWSAALGTSDRADAVSTALVIHHLDTHPGRKSHFEAAQELFRQAAAARTRAVAFMETLQDENTGLLGYETSSYSAWGATAAGLLTFLASDRQSLAARRALVALAYPDRQTYPARDPLREAILVTHILPELPANASRAYIESLTYELARQQKPDGHWPPTKPQTNELLATANSLILAQNLAQLPPARSTRFTSLKPQTLLGHFSKSSARFLLTLTAETADTLLVNADEIRNAHLLTLCSEAALISEIQRIAINPVTSNYTSIARTLAETIDNAKAGPVSFDSIANHIGNEKNIDLNYLLSRADIAAALGTLKEKDLARLAKEIGKLSIREKFTTARNAWARNDRATLEKEIALLTPPTLRPVLEQLAATAATRIHTELQTNPDTLLILDAFLALGPNGILARLGEK